MPSASWQFWTNERLPRLRLLEIQCTTLATAMAPNPQLLDENLRACVMALSAHFQGYCRDLYTECAQIVASKVRPRLQLLIQAQFTAHRKLDQGNPSIYVLRSDFERFGFALDLPAADPQNPARVTHLGELNAWRNIVAHQGTPTATAGNLTLARLQAWLNSCDGLASSLDSVMYNQLRRVLRRDPWTP